MSKILKLLKNKAVKKGLQKAQKHVWPVIQKEIAKRKGQKKR
ncbi:hypothetical protein [Halobacillus massiliensis]|nr:hypothetical protein [Halobacillus massiliensis]